MDVLNSLANFTGKTPLLKFFLIKRAGLRACNFIKKRLQHRFFLLNLQNFREQLFYRKDSVAASENRVKAEWLSTSSIRYNKLDCL